MTSSCSLRTLGLGALIALTLAACGGGNDDPAPAPAPAANPLERDAGFGTAGEVQFSRGALGGNVDATAAQPDGKLLVAGYRTVDTSTDLTKAKTQLFVRRLLENGQPDPAFGIGGEMTFSVLGNDRANELLIQPDSKIVVSWLSREPCEDRFLPVGFCANAAGEEAITRLGLLRLNADGSLDQSFGTSGFVNEPGWGRRGTSATRTVLQPDGKLLRLRTTSDYVSRIFGWSVTRYLANGSIDPAFNGGQPTGSECAADGDAIALKPDGSILIVGTEDGRFCLEQRTPDGRVDVGSPVRIQAPEAATASALRALPDGDIQLSGAASSDAGVRLMGLRLSPVGTPRKTYGTDGFVYVPPTGSAGRRIYRTIIGETGTVLAASTLPTAQTPPDYQRQWLKLDASGRPAPGFGSNGVLTADTLPSNSYMINWVVDRLGRWITVDGNSSDVTITRLQGEKS